MIQTLPASFDGPLSRAVKPTLIGCGSQIALMFFETICMREGLSIVQWRSETTSCHMGSGASVREAVVILCNLF